MEEASNDNSLKQAVGWGDQINIEDALKPLDTEESDDYMIFPSNRSLNNSFGSEKVKPAASNFY